MPDPEKLKLPREFLIVGAAFELGIFDALRKPLSPEELSGKLGAERRGVELLCGALAALGYLAEENGLLSLTPAAEDLFYNTGSAGYLGFSFLYDYYDLEYWLQLPEAARTGLPARGPHGGKVLGALMEKLGYAAGQIAPAVSRLCLDGLAGCPRVIDIGGGSLAYARAFAGGGARVTVLDLPGVIDYIKPCVEGEASIGLVSGDFRRELPPGPFELAFLGNICRLYGEEDNIALMRRVYKVLMAGGRIAILDYLKDMSDEAAFLDINMLLHTRKGRTRPLESYQKWLAGAGFSGISVHVLGARQLILAEKTDPGNRKGG